MRKVSFSSNKAKKLATENNVSIGQLEYLAQDGKIGIAAVREFLNPAPKGSSEQKPETETTNPPAPKAPAKRFVVKEGQKHTGLYLVIDTKPAQEHNAEVFRTRSEAEAKEKAAKLNK